MADSQTEATLALIERFHHTFNTHDVAEIMALMSDDCVFENTFPAPSGTRLSGQAAVRQAWETLFQGAPDAQFTIEELFAAGDRAVLRWTYTWDASNAETGYVRGIDLFRVRNGKVAEKLSYVKG